MLKKLGIPALALFAVMAFAAPPKARAAVRFGISVGAPVYVAPAPAYGYGYGYTPYGYTSPYYYSPAYSYGYAAPVYPYGYYGRGYYRDHDRDRFYERGYRGGGHEYREHGGGHRR